MYLLGIQSVAPVLMVNMEGGGVYALHCSRPPGGLKDNVSSLSLSLHMLRSKFFQLFWTPAAVTQIISSLFPVGREIRTESVAQSYRDKYSELQPQLFPTTTTATFFFVIEPLQKMEMFETRCEGFFFQTCLLAVFLDKTCNYKKLLEERLRPMNTSYRLIYYILYIFSRAKREAAQVACVRTLSSVYASLTSCCDHRVKPLLPPVFPLLLSFSSQVLSQTISRLAWPPLSVSQLSEGKAGGDGTWRRRRAGGVKSALGELAVQPNEAESLFMELRIIFMIISTFSGSAAWQNLLLFRL